MGLWPRNKNFYMTIHIIRDVFWRLIVNRIGVVTLIKSEHALPRSVYVGFSTSSEAQMLDSPL